MLKLSANISLLFAELPFLQRFEAAARAGFAAVEAMYPYDQDPAQMAEQLEAHDLEMSVINLPPGDYSAGERGLATLPGRSADFDRALETGLAYASQLRCRRVHLLTGNLGRGMTFEEVHPTLRRNIARAADYYAGHGILVLLEPLTREMLPHYSLTRVEQALELIHDIGAPNLRLQLDLYHTQQEQGNLAALIERHFDDIDYIQIAGVPGRHEPTVGEINYGYLLDLLQARGFAGWIGCEYVPAAGTLDGLAWARERKLLQPRGDRGKYHI
ncbi:hydroxypyruvate isomerase family protein [Candidimonas nitroreducens]|uniref:Hydroxypyruvate isomerase n=1 Tax=Candidimonas nitroreducens TaxID=683354 RepID=A0A225MQM2_9BURK|nr:TIM barrel protein [Candidimonas nitroreducens]OWT63525.1 hydroxypyruvate isomerase [Candidimonas nitroreducens]